MSIRPSSHFDAWIDRSYREMGRHPSPPAVSALTTFFFLAPKSIQPPFSLHPIRNMVLFAAAAAIVLEVADKGFGFYSIGSGELGGIGAGVGFALGTFVGSYLPTYGILFGPIIAAFTSVSLYTIRKE